MEKLFTIVVAAGRGKRMGAGINKAFLPVMGVPLLVRTLQALGSCPVCEKVAVVVACDELSYAKELLDKYKGKYPSLCCELVTGGKERQDSVYNALKTVPVCYNFVAVHDGARPFVTPEVFQKTYDVAKKTGAAIVAVPASDTVKLVKNNLVETTVDRETVVLTQTPQIFSMPILRAAFEEVNKEGFVGTDDSSLVERYGYRVSVVEGDKGNIKITTPEDIIWANIKCSEAKMDFRVGTGFDVHRFDEGSTVKIGGVDIPHEYSLLGYSDADVLLHAIADALLGAAGLGDIGKFFPDTDPKYKGADSRELLREVVLLLKKENWKINNIDSTIMAQRPKMAPYIEQMKKNIADICVVSVDAVGVKATTTEQLGFVGRQEGIAAQAVATIKSL